jgi:hypothetical protein
MGARAKYTCVAASDKSSPVDAAPGRSEPSGTAAVAVSPGSEMVAVAVRLVSGDEPPLVRLAIAEMVVLAAGQQQM